MIGFKTRQADLFISNKDGPYDILRGHRITVYLSLKMYFVLAKSGEPN